MFSNEQLNELELGLVTLPEKRLELMSGYLGRNYSNARAREYATHGFMRRVKTLAKCVENVFEILPPDRTSIPTMEELSNVEINIQAFVFNAFGSADNLAWIWVFENGVTNGDRTKLRPNHVGLRASNTRVRNSFSNDFQIYLEGLDQWFEYQEDFRHALAHRIPLYVPQYIVHPNDEIAHQTLTEQMTAALNRHDVWNITGSLASKKDWGFSAHA
jgi:hypothetical protein